MSNEPNEQTIVLKEILKWVKFTGLKEVKAILLNSVNNDAKKLFVYHLSDGNHGTKEIAAIAGVGDKTVSSSWDLWLRMGLGGNVPVQHGLRFKRSFDLQEIGIEIPEMKEIKGKTPPITTNQINTIKNTGDQNV